MKIQSIQNQQMQNRQSFEANLRVTKLPNLLGGFWIDSSGLCLKDGSSMVEQVLKSLPAKFRDFVGIDGPKISADGANLRHFQSPSGDKVVLNKSLYEEDAGKPVSIIVKSTDGIEISLGREDINFIDEPPTPSDKLFDDVAEILDRKPQPLIEAEQEQVVLGSIIS